MARPDFTLTEDQLKVVSGKKERLGLFYTKVSPFSQFHEAHFTSPPEDLYGSHKFTCAEMFMMYCKARLFNDDDIAEKILKQTAPPRMKALGRKVKNFDDEVWKNHRYDFVVKGNYYKFSQNQKLKDYLLSTENIYLVEASANDKIWGVGLSKDNPKIVDRKNWKGLNLLGKALMDVRKTLSSEELKNESESESSDSEG